MWDQMEMYSSILPFFKVNLDLSSTLMGDLTESSTYSSCVLATAISSLQCSEPDPRMIPHNPERDSYMSAMPQHSQHVPIPTKQHNIWVSCLLASSRTTQGFPMLVLDVEDVAGRLTPSEAILPFLRWMELNQLIQYSTHWWLACIVLYIYEYRYAIYILHTRFRGLVLLKTDISSTHF